MGRRTLDYSLQPSAPRVPRYPVVLHWLVVAMIVLHLVFEISVVVRLVREWDVDRVYGVGRFGGGGLGGAIFRLMILIIAEVGLLYIVLFRSHESTRIAMIFCAGFHFIAVPFPLANYLGRSLINHPASLTIALVMSGLSVTIGVICILYYHALRRLVPSGSEIIVHTNAEGNYFQL